MNEDLSNIKKDIQEYVETRIELVRLNTAENISRILIKSVSTAATGYLLFFILFFLSFAGGYFFGRLLNSIELGFICIAGFYLLVLVIFLIFRKQIIDKPIIRTILKLFFPKFSDDEKIN
jgi:uncharacterized membrane protein